MTTINRKPKEVGIVKCLNPVEGLGKYIPIGGLLMFPDWNGDENKSTLHITFDKGIDLTAIPVDDYGKRHLVIHWRSHASNEEITALVKKEFESNG
jgi:hypothetical protein